MACIRIVIAFCVLYAQTVWSIRLCRSTLEVGESVTVEANCHSEGVEVTWNSVNDEVDLVQIEYVCRNVSAEDDEGQKMVLLPNTVATSGGRMIYTSPHVAMECTISGCYEEGWFFDNYAIAPAHVTCSSLTQNKVSSTSTPSLQTSDILPSSSNIPGTRLQTSESLPSASSPTPSTTVVDITLATSEIPKSTRMSKSSVVKTSSVETPLTSSYVILGDIPLPPPCVSCNCELETASGSGFMSRTTAVVLVTLIVSVSCTVIIVAALLLVYKKHKLSLIKMDCKGTEETGFIGKN